MPVLTFRDIILYYSRFGFASCWHGWSPDLRIAWPKINKIPFSLKQHDRSFPQRNSWPNTHMASPDLDQVLDWGHSHGTNGVWGERTGLFSGHSQSILKDIEDFTYQVSVRARVNADNHTCTHTRESNAGENKCSIFHHMVRTEYVRWWMIVESVCVCWTLSSGTSQHERKEQFSTWQTSDKAVFHTCPT